MRERFDMQQMKIVERLIQRLPCPQQIKHIDTASEKEAVRFTWRGGAFRVSQNMSVEQIEGSMLKGTNAAILLEALITADLA